MERDETGENYLSSHYYTLSELHHGFYNFHDTVLSLVSIEIFIIRMFV